MTTTPPAAPPGAGSAGPGQPGDPGDPGQPGQPGGPGQPGQPPHDGPRVSGEQMRDLGRLRRTSSSSPYRRHVAGVAGGVARHLDIDPLVVRVLFVVLSFFGGAGLLLYGAGWLLLPEDGREDAPIRLDERSRTVALAVVGTLAALALLGDSFGGWGPPWPLLLIAGVILVVVLARGNRPHPGPLGPSGGPATPAPPSPDVPVTPAGTPPHPDHAAGHPGYPSGYQAGPFVPPPGTPPPYPRPPRTPRPRKPGLVLFWPTLAAIALGWGVLGMLDVAGVLDPPSSAYPALAVALSGLALLLGSVWGRAGGLIALGLVASLVTLGATAIDQTDPGRVSVTPTTAAALDDSYRQTAGELRVDLSRIRDLDALDGRTLDLEARVGRIELIVPARGLDVVVDATIEGAGDTTLFDRYASSSDRAVHDGGVDAPRLQVEVQVEFGEIQVDVRPERTLR